MYQHCGCTTKLLAHLQTMADNGSRQQEQIHDMLTELDCDESGVEVCRSIWSDA